jgi:hypothetical protein
MMPRRGGAALGTAFVAATARRDPRTSLFFSPSSINPLNNPTRIQSQRNLSRIQVGIMHSALSRCVDV